MSSANSNMLDSCVFLYMSLQNKIDINGPKQLPCAVRYSILYSSHTTLLHLTCRLLLAK